MQFLLILSLFELHVVMISRKTDILWSFIMNDPYAVSALQERVVFAQRIHQTTALNVIPSVRIY